jgi:nicotinamidase-related amidase
MEDTARVWDRFLTPRDKQSLRLHWGKRSPVGFGSKPVVVVIDDFRLTLGDRPLPLLESVEEWPLSSGLEGWAAVERTRYLLQHARSVGVPVVYTKNDIDEPPWGPPEERIRAGLSDEKWARRYEIVPEIEPQSGDLVIVKSSASAFFGTPLISHLMVWRIDTVLLCGNATSGCVRAAAIDAAAYRFRVGVIEDCCFDRTEASHAINLFDIDHKYGDVVSSTDAVAYVERLGQPPTAGVAS